MLSLHDTHSTPAHRMSLWCVDVWCGVVWCGVVWCGVVCMWCMCGVYGDVFVHSCVVNENRVYTHRVLLTNAPGSSRWRTSDVILQG